MLNKEKFANEIIDIASRGGVISFDAINNKISICSRTNCDICGFRRREKESCADNCLKWCNSEYVEPEVDWSKVPIDTPVLVKVRNEDTWINRYFAYYKDGNVFTYTCGATSWSSDGSEVLWNYAKLANEEDINKYAKTNDRE